MLEFGTGQFTHINQVCFPGLLLQWNNHEEYEWI